MSHSSHVKFMRPRVPERILEVADRVKNFEEIKGPYTEQEAALEATRCVYCRDAPCVQACPVHIDVPRFIDRLRMKDPEGAIRIIRASCYLPGICARVCPVDLLCEGACAWITQDAPVAIGLLQRFAADYERRKRVAPVQPPRGKSAGRVAVAGSGPAGLAVAAKLTEMGHEVTIYEAESELGGLLTHGISPMKLPFDVARYEIEYLTKLGVNTVTNTMIESVDDLLKQGYDAVFIGIGLLHPKRLGIPGEDLRGVYPAVTLIRKVLSSLREFKALPEEFLGKKVAVIGGGNSAILAARTSLRLGAEGVTILYRRSLSEMPAYLHDVNTAKEEGVEFQVGVLPSRILGKERVEGLECVRVRWKQDTMGNHVPSAVEGSQFKVDTDFVIVAIGQALDLEFAKRSKLRLTELGNIFVDERFQTSRPGIFAAGDAASKGGRATIVQTLADAGQAAESINEYVMRRCTGETRWSRWH